jgi:membrane AbrB-like protein
MSDELAQKKDAAVPIILTLCFAAVGGAAFDYLRAPLPWMIGAMVVTTVAALSGVPIQRSNRLRNYMVGVLGTMLGTGFTPQTVTGALDWGPTLLAMLLYVSTIGTVSYFYLTRIVKYDRVSSFFASAPGGLIEMVNLGSSYGGDERTMSLVHSMRLLLTVMIIPFWFRFFQGYDPSAVVVTSHSADFTLLDLAILFACTVVGYIGGKILRLPAYAMLGPLTVSGLAHVTGLSDARIPQELINIAQVILGASIGCQFAGLALKKVFGNLIAGSVTTFIMLGTAAAFAVLMSHLTGIDYKALVIAFSPGGLAEMSLISLTMGIDIAFVSTHHLFRVLSLLILAPIIFKVMQSYVKRREQEPTK